MDACTSFDQSLGLFEVFLRWEMLRRQTRLELGKQISDESGRDRLGSGIYAAVVNL